MSDNNITPMDESDVEARTVAEKNIQPINKQLAPTGEQERLRILDSLRGVALVGILMMNIEWFGRTIDGLGSFDKSLTGLDHAAGWFVRFFVEGKFYKLFALLFGMGFAIMLIKAQQAKRPFGWWFTRRMIALYFFGVLHLTLLWIGDILHDYALSGMLMLGWVFLFKTKRFERVSIITGTLKTGLWIMLVPLVITIIVAFGYGVSHSQTGQKAPIAENQQVFEKAKNSLEHLLENRANNKVDHDGDESIQDNVNRDNAGTAEQSEFNEGKQTNNIANKDSSDEKEPDIDKMSAEERVEYLTNKRVEQLEKREERKNSELHAMKSDRYLDVVRFNLKQTPSHLGLSIFFGLFMLMPIFMLGYWLIATEKLTRVNENRSFFQLITLVGLLAGFAMTAAGLLLLNYPDPAHSKIVRNVGNTLFSFAQYLVSAGYLGAFVLLYQNASWQKILNVFAPIGRMALTNYISHTLILSFVFFGYGAGLYGEVSRSEQMLVVIAIIAVQIFACHFWLRYFRFGPLEWLWRSITYWKIQPIMH